MDSRTHFPPLYQLFRRDRASLCMKMFSAHWITPERCKRKQRTSTGLMRRDKAKGNKQRKPAELTGCRGNSPRTPPPRLFISQQTQQSRNEIWTNSVALSAWALWHNNTRQFVKKTRQQKEASWCSVTARFTIKRLISAGTFSLIHILSVFPLKANSPDN